MEMAPLKTNCDYRRNHTFVGIGGSMAASFQTIQNTLSGGKFIAINQ